MYKTKKNNYESSLDGEKLWNSHKNALDKSEKDISRIYQRRLSKLNSERKMKFIKKYF